MVHSYFGGFIKKVLDDSIDLVMHEWDGVFLIVGDEGDGKTTLVKHMAWYVDPKITINDVAFNAVQFEEAVEQADEYSSLLWDESDDLSGHWASVMIQTLKRKFKRIRKKHLFIWLVTPTFFDLNKYWAVHRARCLFHVYAEPRRDAEGKFHANRGRVRFFNKDNKRKLYFGGVKTWDMYCRHPDFVDAFLKVPTDYPISDIDYETKKDEATKMVTVSNEQVKASDIIIKIINRLENWFNKVRTHNKLSIKDLSELFNVSERTINRYLQINKKNNDINTFETENEGGVPFLTPDKADITISSLEQNNNNPESEGTL